MSATKTRPIRVVVQTALSPRSETSRSLSLELRTISRKLRVSAARLEALNERLRSAGSRPNWETSAISPTTRVVPCGDSPISNDDAVKERSRVR